ncbi:MAG TPA: hypothetical protein VFP95_04715 [Gammaproteobacteria bacterium]|nr:hypothetical protein [Gammaproteobacteria bacterium]
MRRLTAIAVVLSIAFSCVAWANDVHETTPADQHQMSADQTNSDVPSRISEFCGHYCHGSSHHLALRDSDGMSIAVQINTLPVAPLRQPASWLQAPPTPPPNI